MSSQRGVTMSFAIVDTGFSSGRYSFDGPDFGPWDVDWRISDGVAHRGERCGTCGQCEVNFLCVACADYAFIRSASLTNAGERVIEMPNLGVMTDTMGAGDGDVPDSVGGEDGDLPDSIGGQDDDDESQDDDTDSERM
jgi:hypothetical protein